MKFDCSEKIDYAALHKKVEGYKREQRAWQSRYQYLFEWHQWFAWYPVEISKSDCRWLETIERRGHPYSVVNGVYRWDYRACSPDAASKPIPEEK